MAVRLSIFAREFGPGPDLSSVEDEKPEGPVSEVPRRSVFSSFPPILTRNCDEFELN